MTKFLVASSSLGCGFCAVGDSLGKAYGSLVMASLAFEHLIPVMKLRTSTTKALAAHYNPLERPICGLFMTSNYNHSQEEILHTHQLEPISS